LSINSFLKKLNVLEAGCVSILKKGDHSNQAIFSDGTIESVNLLRYAPENRSSPRVVAGN